MPQKTDRYRVVALARGLALLESLVGSGEGLTMTELARGVRASKPSALRLLATLQGAGFVERNSATARYHLTYRIGSLAARHYQTLGVNQPVESILRQLSRETGELAELGMVSGGETMVVVATSEGTHRLKVEAAKLGEQLPPHATALGKAWLAQLREGEALRICKAHGLQAYTSHTLTTLKALRQEIREIRAQGYAVSREERYEGTFGVAAPVMSQPGGKQTCLGAVVLLLPLSRVSGDRVRELARRVIKAGEELSEHLGAKGR